jgi:PilZ domain
MSSGAEKRKAGRVEFSRGIPTRIVAIDGTWSRDCLMLDVAAGGAKLTAKESVTGLNLKEFFLVLSTTGAAYRRCELVWLNGDQLGVRFLEADRRSKRSSPI